MMAGVELVLSCGFRTTAVEALSKQLSLQFEADYSVPMTRTFKQRCKLWLQIGTDTDVMNIKQAWMKSSGWLSAV